MFRIFWLSRHAPKNRFLILKKEISFRTTQKIKIKTFSNCSGESNSIIFPASITIILSESIMVLSLWATVITVASLHSSLMIFWIALKSANNLNKKFLTLRRPTKWLAGAHFDVRGDFSVSLIREFKNKHQSFHKCWKP